MGPLVRDREMLQYQAESVQICVTQKDAGGRDARRASDPAAERVVRLSHRPVGRRDRGFPGNVKIERGDVLHVTPGRGPDSRQLAARLGYLEGDVEETDLRTFSWAIVLRHS